MFPLMFPLAWFPWLETHVIVRRVSVFRVGTQAELQLVNSPARSLD